MRIKNLYSILFLLVMLLPIGCTDADIQQVEQDIEDAKKVYLQIGVTLPEGANVATRAFNNASYTFGHLYVAVFVEQHNTYFLEEFVRAENPVPEPNESGYWKFGVELSPTDGPRRLHFIANYPDLGLPFGEESNVIGRLLTSEKINEHDVYWNCLDIDKIEDGCEEQMERIPLVRNFSQIKLTIGQDLKDKFLFTGYAVHNVPKRGTVAPFNSTKGTFANYVNSFSCKSYNELVEIQGYTGNEPYDNELEYLTAWKTFEQGKSSDVFYMYERSHVNVKDPTSIIIEGIYAPDGNFNGVSKSYYKLDFVYRDDETNANVYYHLLRNFIYTMNIVDVKGVGYKTADDAIKNPASNNISGNANVENFTNISDGFGRLFVSTTYIAFTDDTPVDVYYQYIPDIQKPSVKKNDLDGVNDGEITLSASAKEDGVLAMDAIVSASDERSGSHKGWRKITLVPRELQNIEDVIKQEVTIATDELQRKITLVLSKPYEMDVQIINPESKVVAAEQKQSVDLKITIPGGMAMSLFPLKFYVTSEMNTIYAKPGTNLYSETFEGGFGFVKEISWDFYNSSVSTGDGINVAKKEAGGKVSFICNFLTNTANSATEIFVQNEHFYTGQDGFDNVPGRTSVQISNSIGVEIQKSNGRYPQNIYGNGTDNGTRSVSFSYNGTNYTLTIDKDHVITSNPVTLQNSNGIDPNTVLTLTFTDNDYAGKGNWSTNPRTYTATCTVRQLIGGTILKFTSSELSKEVELSIDPTTIGVNVQQSNFRYPFTIDNNRSNNGVYGNVQVKLGSESVGTLSMNKDYVTSTSVNLSSSEGFKDSDLLTFTFTDKYYLGDGEWLSTPVTYTATCTVRDLKKGTTLVFTVPGANLNTRLEITDDSFGGVSVQQEKYTYTSTSYMGSTTTTVYVYPRKIHNSDTGLDAANTKRDNGTETVEIFYNGGTTPVGRIIIDIDSVNGLQDASGNPIDEIVISDDVNGIDLSAELEFKFKDNYCTSLKTSNNGNRVSVTGYNFSDNEVGYEYKAILTIEEFLEGKRLNFVRQSIN